MVRRFVKLLLVAGAALMLTAVQAHEEPGKPVPAACPDESEIASCSVQCMLALDVKHHISNEADRVIGALPGPRFGILLPSFSIDLTEDARACDGYCKEIHQALCLNRCARRHGLDSLYPDPTSENECRASCVACNQR